MTAEQREGRQRGKPIDAEELKWERSRERLTRRFERRGLSKETAHSISRALSDFSEEPPVIEWAGLTVPLQIELQVFGRPLVLSFETYNLRVSYFGRFFCQEVRCGTSKVEEVQLFGNQENGSQCLFLQFPKGNILGIEKDELSQELIFRGIKQS